MKRKVMKMRVHRILKVTSLMRMRNKIVKFGGRTLHSHCGNLSRKIYGRIRSRKIRNVDVDNTDIIGWASY